MIQGETYLETHSIRLTKHDLSFKHPQIYQEIFARFTAKVVKKYLKEHKRGSF